MVLVLVLAELGNGRWGGRTVEVCEIEVEVGSAPCHLGWARRGGSGLLGGI